MSLAKEFEGQLWIRAADHQAELAQQAAVIEQMLNLINAYHSPDHPLRLQALAIQPCPEVLNKVRADTIHKTFKLMMDGRWRGDALDVLADRMERGEA